LGGGSKKGGSTVYNSFFSSKEMVPSSEKVRGKQKSKLVWGRRDQEEGDLDKGGEKKDDGRGKEEGYLPISCRAKGVGRRPSDG